MGVVFPEPMLPPLGAGLGAPPPGADMARSFSSQHNFAVILMFKKMEINKGKTVKSNGLRKLALRC